MVDLDRDTLDTILKDTDFSDFSSCESAPNYILSGSGFDWFVDPDTYTMVRIQRGTEVVPIDFLHDEGDRVLVRILHRFILVNKDEVQEIGFN